MFQGSANVAKGEHFSLVQAAGGTLNAITWLDRTNYFETLPGHELELALWLEADRMASLLPAMTQEKLDNQRDVVKNERRWSVDNQPYGDWDERMQALVYPEGHPYHHPTIGSMEDLSAASLDDVGEFFATYYAPNNAVLTIAGDFETDAALDHDRAPLRPDPGRTPTLPPPPDMASTPRIGSDIRETVPDQVPLPRIYLAHRIPPFGTDAFDALDVAADVLGSGRASRLYAQPRPRAAPGAGRERLRLPDRRRRRACSRSGSPPGPASRPRRSRPRPWPRSIASRPTGRRDADLERVRNLHAAARRRRRSSGSASGPIGSACTPASSTSRSASTPRSRATTAVDAGRVARRAARLGRARTTA